MKVLYKPDEAPAGAEEQDYSDVAYEVEEIINHRGHNGQQDFLVKWKNYALEHNSWVKLNGFHYHNLVHDYLNKTHGLSRSGRTSTAQAQSSSVTASSVTTFIHPSRQSNP